MSSAVVGTRRITERTVMSFGSTNPVSVATKDLFAVCEQTGNVPIILLPPTHGQRPPPRLSGAAKRLLSSESAQKQEEAFAKKQAEISDKKAKKQNPITRTIHHAAPPENKQEAMSGTLGETYENEEDIEEADDDDEESNSNLPDEDEDDVKQYMADDDDEDGDEQVHGAVTMRSLQSVDCVVNSRIPQSSGGDDDDNDNDEQQPDDQDADADDKVVKKQKLTTTTASKKPAKTTQSEAGSATSKGGAKASAPTRKKAASAKVTDPLREQNKAVLKKMKDIFSSQEFKDVRTDDMRRIAFAIAHDVVIKDVVRLRNGPSLYDEMVDFSKLTNRVDAPFPWYGKLTKSQIADAIKRMLENANRVERTLDTIEPKIKKVRQDLLADAIDIANLPDPIEASGDDVVRCDVLAAPVHRRDTTNLQVTHKDEHRSTMRVCSGLVDGVKAIVTMLTFPLAVKKLCEERYEKKTKKSRGKAARDTIVRGQSTIAEAIKKLVDDQSLSSVVTKSTALVTKMFTSFFAFVGRFENARKLIIQDAAAVLAAAAANANAASLGVNGSVGAAQGYANSFRETSNASDQDFVDVADDDDDADDNEPTNGVEGVGDAIEEDDNLEAQDEDEDQAL